MSRHTYTRDDVETHYGVDRPAVNVKVYDLLDDGYRKFRKDEPDADETFTVEWIRDNVSEDRLDSIFWSVCESEFECLSDWATGKDDDPLFPGDDVTLERDGRMGGWIVVRGLPEIDEWDAVRLARWRKFARIARDIADGVMLNVVSSIYINEYEWQLQEAERAACAANYNIATVPA